MRKLTAPDGIEHPAGHGDLHSIRQQDHIDRLPSSPQPPDDFNFRPAEGMMRILNPR